MKLYVTFSSARSMDMLADEYAAINLDSEPHHILKDFAT